jgi:hypothetical protein
MSSLPSNAPSVASAKPFSTFSTRASYSPPATGSRFSACVLAISTSPSSKNSVSAYEKSAFFSGLMTVCILPRALSLASSLSSSIVFASSAGPTFLSGPLYPCLLSSSLSPFITALFAPSCICAFRVVYTLSPPP